MNPILSTGLLIGLSCSVWMFVMGFTGWYKEPALANLFFLVIAIEIAGLFWGLRKTAAEGRAYAGQVVAGTMMAIVAGVVIVAASLLFTIVVFPDSVREMEQAGLQPQGRSAAEIASGGAAGAASATPMAQAMSGFVGTLLTGIIASAVMAIFVRRPGTSRPAAR